MGELSVENLIGMGRTVAAAAAPLTGAAAGAARGGGAEEGAARCGRWVHLREWWGYVSAAFAGSLESLAVDVVLLHRSGRTLLGRASGELWRIDGALLSRMQQPALRDARNRLGWRL